MDALGQLAVNQKWVHCRRHIGTSHTVFSLLSDSDYDPVALLSLDENRLYSAVSIPLFRISRHNL